VCRGGAGEGKLLAQSLAHGGAVKGVSFHPSNTQLLTAGADGLVKAWALPPVPARSLSHPDAVLAAALSADGKRLVTGGKDKVVRTWNPANSEVERQLTGHTAPVTAVAPNANAPAPPSARASPTLTTCTR